MISINLFKNILWLQWIAATGAMVMLFSLGLMIGWTSPYMAKLTSENSTLPLTAGEVSWVVSFLNLGRFAGAIIGGVSVQYFGSKQTLVVTGFPLITALTCIILANSVIWLYVARITAGLSLGMAFASFPLYLGEISSPTLRGTLVSLAMSGVNFGTLIGNIMGAYLSMTQFACISLFPTVFFTSLFLWIPQSPHHLVRLDKFDDAEKSIVRYNPQIDSKVEFESLKNFLATTGKLTIRDRLREFNVPRNRRAGFVTLGLYFFMQFSGLNSVMFYMETIFITSKLTVIAPSTGVIIAGVVGVAAGWASICIADKFRRKVLMIVSSAGVAVAMVGLGSHFALLDNGFDPNDLQWLPIGSVLMFEVFVCNGLVAVPNMILSELFPSDIKSLAACFASIFIGLCSFVAAKSYQPLLFAIGEAYVFWIHALLMVFCIIFSLIWLPETKGKSLQEIQDALTGK